MEEPASLLARTKIHSAKPPTQEESAPVATLDISTTKLPRPASHLILSAKHQIWLMEPVSPASLVTPFVEADARLHSKTPIASHSMPAKPTASSAQPDSTPVQAENAFKLIPSVKQLT